ncbi:DNA helicase [Ranunculus cassubicifolius]
MVDFILLDEAGDQIHGSVQKIDATKFEDYLHVDNAVIVRNFRMIERRNKYYCPLPLRYTLELKTTAEMENLQESITFPPPKFHIVPFEELRKRVESVTYLSDVIGICTKITDQGTSRNGAPKKEMLIRNERDEEIAVTLWDNIARNIPSFLTDTSQKNIVVIAAAIVKNDGGMVALVSTKGTRLYVNPDIPAVVPLQQRLQMPPTRKRSLIPAVDTKTLLYVKQLLNRNVENGGLICRAKIMTVYHDEGWSYLACPTCRRKPNKNDNRYWCKQCRVFVNLPILKYMIQVRIKDAYAELNATAFKEASLELVGMTTDELSALGDDNDNGDDVVYTQLETMVDKDYYFSLKTTNFKSGDTTSSVTISRAWPDESSPAKIPRLTATED